MPVGIPRVPFVKSYKSDDSERMNKSFDSEKMNKSDDKVPFAKSYKSYDSDKMNQFDHDDFDDSDKMNQFDHDDFVDPDSDDSDDSDSDKMNQFDHDDFIDPDPDDSDDSDSDDNDDDDNDDNDDDDFDKMHKSDDSDDDDFDFDDFDDKFQSQQYHPCIKIKKKSQQCHPFIKKKKKSQQHHQYKSEPVSEPVAAFLPSLPRPNHNPWGTPLFPSPSTEENAVVKVPAKTKVNGEEELEWIDIYDRLYRERFVFLFDELTSELTNRIVGVLTYLNLEDPTREVSLFINSPGGGMSSGVAVYDTMQYVKPEVHTIGMGTVASMASFILLGGMFGKRIALSQIRVMIHQPRSAKYRSKTSKHCKEGGEILKMRDRIVRVYEERTGKPASVISDDMDRDFFMTAEQAKTHGIVDSVQEKTEEKDNKGPRNPITPLNLGPNGATRRVGFPFF